MKRHIAEERLKELEGRLHYTFRNRDLLMTALTHTSFANEHGGRLQSNERLEFLGDSVISMVLSDILMKEFPREEEGGLTLIRAYLVNQENLSRLARRLGLAGFILLGKGEEENGGRGKGSILASLFEAVVGAIYLDTRGSIPLMNGLLKRYFKGRISYVKRKKRGAYLDVKSFLIRKVRREKRMLPEFRITAEYGPEHEKIYEVEIIVEGRSLGKGKGRSKKDAEIAASRSALRRMKGKNLKV